MSLSTPSLLAQAVVTVALRSGAGGRWLLGVALACVLVLGGACPAAPSQEAKKADREAPRAEEIDGLIGKLGSAEAAEREAASRHCRPCGRRSRART